MTISVSATFSPESALRPISFEPAVKKILAGRLPSPGQYATPRLLGLPPVTLKVQRVFPESGSSARMRLPAGKYITPSMTIGVACEKAPDHRLPGPWCRVAD